MGRVLLAMLAASLLALGAMAPAAGPARGAPPRPSIDAYRGAGAWVSIYSRAQLRRPEATVARLAAAGVRTLYLETANHRRSPRVLIVHPAADARFLDAAHGAGLRVIAWYLPGLDDLAADTARAQAALDFASPAGERFDGFALDIESTNVRSIAARNARLLWLARRLRAAVGPAAALGAIVPDSLSTTCCLWPGFPYAAVARWFDVFLPMAYSTNRGRGAAFVRRYTWDNVRRVRARTGRPVHAIAGLADGLRFGEATAAVQGARDAGAVGVSFYDFGLSGPEEWLALSRWPRCCAAPAP
jgi:hypothetical protein